MKLPKDGVEFDVIALKVISQGRNGQILLLSYLAVGHNLVTYSKTLLNNFFSIFTWIFAAIVL